MRERDLGVVDEIAEPSMQGEGTRPHLVHTAERRFVEGESPAVFASGAQTPAHRVIGASAEPRTAQDESVHRRALRICMMVTYDLASPGGVKQHAFDLAAGLRARGDDVVIVGPSSRPLADPDLQTFAGVIDVPANGSSNKLGIFTSPLAVRRFFQRNEFDVIHVHEPLQPTLAYWSIWFTRHIPHVATFHAYAESESTMLKWARRFWGTTVFPWYQRGIAVSPLAETYANVAWKRPLTVIPNGVSTSAFDRSHRRKIEPAVRLLFVGRLGDRRKGVHVLFEAYRELVGRGLDVVLDVAGELGDVPAPPPLPGLTYHGAVDREHLIQLYSNCDIFIAPSTGQESFGIVLLEAMASGKAIICSDIDGYRHVAGPGTKLITPGDPRVLAATIADLVTAGPGTRRSLGELNRHHVTKFDWRTIVDRVRDVYLDAIDERAPGVSRPSREVALGKALAP
jgi:phosphatidylinositol alpha-mannosyltransferase